MKLIKITFTVFMIAFMQTTHAQTFVNAAATGNNDGSSWANAYTELHDALENYNAGDEIWVAAGRYLPQIPSALPSGNKTFYIYQNAMIYGGFAGTETLLTERAPLRISPFFPVT